MLRSLASSYEGEIVSERYAQEGLRTRLHHLLVALSLVNRREGVHL